MKKTVYRVMNDNGYVEYDTPQGDYVEVVKDMPEEIEGEKGDEKLKNKLADFERRLTELEAKKVVK